MREYSTLAFVMAFSLITNICSNVAQCRLNLLKQVKVLNACPGSAYSKYQQKFFVDHYRVYDGGVEGIRNACESDGQKCHFHAYVQNSSILMDGVIFVCECTCTGLQ